jgi:endonuclease/exonuclease/phosphatase family metal-dependent hydrolase
MPQGEHGRTYEVRVATYNVHRCRGMDARTLPQRIAAVLAGLDADVVALQEVVGASQRRAGQAAELGALLGMGWVMAPTRHLRGALFGNVVLTRHPVRRHIQHDLSWKTCEPRGAQRVDVGIDDRHLLHIFNVHMGTSLGERRVQAQKLADLVDDARAHGPSVVLGDFNEWARGLTTDILSSRLHSVDLTRHLPRRRSYPGFFPLLHLDHIYYTGRVEVLKVELVRTRQALMASDHLPLVADLRITP